MKNSTLWNGFDYVKNNNPNLVITIGDSWTWGDSLNSKWKEYDDKEFRLANVYGGQLAKKLDADFLNIAEPGQSNLWIANHLDFVVDRLAEFNNYHNVYVVLTLTEVGREFNGDLDHLRVYTDLFANVKTFRNFLDILSMQIYQQINKHLDKINLTIGANFVDPNYPDDLGIVERTWVDLIAQETGQQNVSECFVVLSWVYERFGAIFDFVPTLNQHMWLQDVLKHMELSTQRTNLLLQSTLNYKQGSKHPTPTGHAIWADYLYDKIVSQRKASEQAQ